MQNFRYNLKKAAASKVVESQVGRKIIQQNVGTEGVHFVDAIKSAAVKFKDRSTGKHHKQVLYKMVLKAKLMVDEGLVSSEDGQPISEQWSKVYPLLSSALERETETLDDLQIALENLSSLVVSIVGGHMKEKNKNLLIDSIKFFTDTEFIKAVATDPDYCAEKDTMLESIKHIQGIIYDPTSLGTEISRVSVALFSDKYSTVIQAVQIFWRLVTQKEKEVGELVFAHLFEESPEFQPLFQMSVEKQQKLFMAMLDKAFTGLHRFEKHRETLQLLGEVHVKRGIPYTAYRKMWIALDKSLKEVFPKDYTKIAQRSCKLIFTHLADVIRSCYPPEDVNDSKEEQQETLSEFWDHVIEEEETVGRTMYGYLFEGHAKYEDLFSGDFGDQRRMFTMITKLLSKIIANLENFHELEDELRMLGRLHVEMKVPLNAFRQMWNALDLALSLIFEISFTPRLRSHLRGVFMKIVQIFDEEYSGSEDYCDTSDSSPPTSPRRGF